MTVVLRQATPFDASIIAELAILEGQGLAGALWSGMANSDETAHDVGTRLAKQDFGTFSWSNTVVAEIDGKAAGIMISHMTADAPEPLVEDMHPSIRPLVSLENQALQMRFINLLAVLDRVRGQGVGDALLRHAVSQSGPLGTAAVAGDANPDGLQFYADHGFSQRAKAPIIATNWDADGTFWHLMHKAPD